MASKEAALSLKILVDTKARRVLFAEAEKELVDFLFSLLALPLGSIIQLVRKKNMVGSLANLYESVEKISATYLQPNLDRNLLLKPKSILSVGNVPLLGGESSKFNKGGFGFGSAGGEGSTFPGFGSARGESSKFNKGTPAFGSAGGEGSTFYTPNFNVPPFGVPNFQERETGGSRTSSTDVGGYVKGLVTYMVTDELEVMPMSTISSITLLKKYNALDVGCIEEKIVGFGIQGALEVLKATLRSKTVLTDVFLQKKPKLETPSVFDDI